MTQHGFCLSGFFGPPPPPIPSVKSTQQYKQQPNSESLTGGYSRFWHRIVVPTSQPMSSRAGTTALCHSGTRNLAPEPVFLNVYGNQESIPRHQFRQPSVCSLAGRYDNPIPTLCLAPIDFLQIPALFCGDRVKQQVPTREKLEGWNKQF